ncbi:hypothetical protein ACRQ4B_06130 [Curtobacterium sp. SP.BCo]|uniref:hypothetical protein n=1 Tax=Curtobacterium sp. SP.BCo TaxID=3435229 RepID=UPI003F73D443
MTDTAAAAEWRWAQADEQARLVLAAPPLRHVSIPLVVGGLVAVLAVLIGIASVSDPESAGRWVTGIAGAVVGLGLIGVDVVSTVQGRTRHPERAAVTRSLSGRERHAVDRVIRGRVTAPDDRAAVVLGTAVQTAAGRSLPSVTGQVVLFTGVAVSGTWIWFLYTAAAVVSAMAVAVAIRDVVLARWYLAAEPERLRSRPLPDRNSGTRSGRSGGS